MTAKNQFGFFLLTFGFIVLFLSGCGASTTSTTVSTASLSSSTTTTPTTTTLTSTTTPADSTTTSTLSLPPTWNLVFHLEGGTLEAGVAAEFLGLSDGANVDLPIPLRDGYEFYGWYTDPDTWNDGPYGNDFTVNQNGDFYARWEVPTLSPMSFFSEWNSGKNHVFHSVFLHEDLNGTLRAEELRISCRTYPNASLRQVVFDLGFRDPAQENRFEVIDGYKRYDEAIIGEGRYVFQKNADDPIGILIGMEPGEQPGSLGSKLDLSPFQYLQPGNFERVPCSADFLYVPAETELTDFAAGIVGGTFITDEVQALYNGTGHLLLIRIPILADPEGSDWKEAMTLFYSLEDPDSDLEFPLQEAKAAVLHQWTQLCETRLASTDPTPQSQKNLTDAYQTALESLQNVTTVDQLFEQQWLTLTLLQEIPLVFDVLHEVKSVQITQLEKEYAEWTVLATDASILVMDPLFETMVQAVETAQYYPQITEALETGWRAIRLAFVEDPLKADFERSRDSGLMWIAQFQTMVQAVVPATDPLWGQLETMILSARTELETMTYASGTLIRRYTLRDNLWSLFSSYQGSNLEAYRICALAEVDRLFFLTAIQGPDAVKTALDPFIALRRTARTSIESATTFRGIWDALVTYADGEKDQTVGILRESLQLAQSNLFNQTYYRIPAESRSAFVEEFLRVRDLLEDAVSPKTIDNLDYCLTLFVDGLPRDPLENAKRDAIASIQELLIFYHPRATDASQTDMYNAQVAAYDQIYAATTPEEALSAGQNGEMAILSVFVIDWAKADLVNERTGADVRMNDELYFYAWFTTDYSAYAEVICLTVQARYDLLASYDVPSVHNVETAWRTAVSATGYQWDAAKVEEYRQTILGQIAQTLTEFSEVPPPLQTAYDQAVEVISLTPDPLRIRTELIAYLQVYHANQ